MPFYRYSRWDGTQQVSPIHEDDLIEQLSEELVAHGDISNALRSMVQRGLRDELGRNVSGIQDMLQRLSTMRQDTLDKYDLAHILDNIQQQLQEIGQTERRGVQKRLADAHNRFTSQPDRIESHSYSSGGRESDATPTQQERERLLVRLEEMARRNLKFLDNLPSQPAQAIQQLKKYEFMEDEARARFDELLKSLQQRVLESYLRNLTQNFNSVGPGQHTSLKGFLRELNRLLEEHISGGESASRTHFDRFMQKYGDLLGPRAPAGVYELAEDLRQQMAQMESLLKSLSPELRQELEETLSSIFRDEELRDELARIASNLEYMGPDDAPAERFLFQGDEPLGLEETLEVMQQLQRMEELEHQLRKTQQGHQLDDVNPELMRELMGEESCRELKQLMRVADTLENAGYIRPVGGRFELTPKGIRRIGHRALREIFDHMRKDRLGQHRTKSTGTGGDWLEDTKKHEYGDPFHLHLQRSVMNAVQRAAGTPVWMSPDDFEIYRTEQASHAATVLMVDLSLSMAMRGNFVAAKKVALALDNLIRAKFPKDSLHIVGFSTYARELKAEMLAYLSWDEFDPYTNIQHGLSMARRFLAKSPGRTKQIIMVSDGEPTAHIEGGQLFQQYPPSPRTIRETLKEVKRCTRQDIKINTFMLERSSHLVEFVDQMTKINRGRVFYTNPNKLGEYILVDYLTSRRKQLVLSQLGFGNCLRKRLRLLPFFRSVDVGGWQPWDENGMWSGWKGKNETSWND